MDLHISNLARTDDRDILMLIDYLADHLSTDLSDDFPSLAEQFAAIEEGRSYLPSYPGSFSSHKAWKEWREYRDARVAHAFRKDA